MDFVTAQLNDRKQARLNRKVSESSVSHYEAGKSVNAKDFRMIAAVAYMRDGTAEYFITDEQPVSGAVYFRIRQIDLDRTYSYSRMVTFSGDGFRPLSGYRNPVRDLESVEIGSAYIGCRLKLINAAGIVPEQMIVNETTLKATSINMPLIFTLYKPLTTMQ